MWNWKRNFVLVKNVFLFLKLMNQQMLNEQYGNVDNEETRRIRAIIHEADELLKIKKGAKNGFEGY